MDLHYVQPIELHDYWDLVAPGIETVKRRTREGWLREDVYTALKSNSQNVTMHICQDEAGEYLGFVVLVLQNGWDGFEMNVWLAYSAIKEVQPLEQWFDQIKAIAKRAGAKRVRFESPRQGWEKKARDIGAKPHSTIYKAEV